MDKAYIRVKDVREKNRPLGVYIGILQNKGKLRKYLDKDGFVCYSAQEYEEYSKKARRGRPSKNAVVITD